MMVTGIRNAYLLRLLLLLLVIAVSWQIEPLRDVVQQGLPLIKRHDFPGLRLLLLGYGSWAPLCSIALMTLQSVIPFVPGLVLTMANAWLFGWQLGALYSWTGALCGAALDFYLARMLGRPWLGSLAQRPWLGKSERLLAQQGFGLVFLTRLTPLLPFKLISYGAGLTGLPVGRYLLATAAGQTLPIALYSYLGQELQRNWRAAILLTFLAAAMAVVLYCWSHRQLRQEENGKK